MQFRGTGASGNDLQSFLVTAECDIHAGRSTAERRDPADHPALVSHRFEQCEYIYKAINEIPGLSAVKPKAGFYIFPKIDVKRFNITDDEQFTFDLLREKKILLISGKGFNWKQPDHFRIVYLPRIEVLEEAVEKMTDFFKYYRQ